MVLGKKQRNGAKAKGAAKKDKKTPQHDGNGNKKNNVNKQKQLRKNKNFNRNGGDRIGRPVADKFLDGEAAKARNEKKAFQLEKRDYSRDVANLAGAIINASLGERTEDLFCFVNPHIISQYIWGIVMKPMSSTTNFEDLQTSLQLFKFFMSNFHNMPQTLADKPIPKALVELRAALEPRRKGRYNFIPEWSMMIDMGTDIASNGILGSNLGITYQYPTTVQASGFINSQSTIPSIAYNDVDKFITKFASFYKPITYDKWVDNPRDASAFAFDVGGPSSNADVPCGNTMAFMAGFDLGGLPVFLRQSGIAGLEVKIRRQHLAALRVCTSCVRTRTPLPVKVVNNVRRPIKFIRCDTTPSVLAWNYNSDIAGRVQLKAVPANSVGRDVRAKIEAVVQIKDTSAANTIYTDWISSSGFSNLEIRILCAALVKAQSVQYSGAYFGTVLLNSNAGATTINYPMKNEYHAYTALLSSIRTPEMLNRCLGSQRPFLGKYSTIIPWRGAIDPAQIASQVISDSAYVGVTDPPSPTFVIPSIEEQWSLFTKWSFIINKYRSREMKLETRAVMAYQSKLGPTMLDMTCVQNVSNFGFMSVSAQRSLDQYDINAFFACPGYLTYDYTDQNTYQNREYGQFNRYDCGGLDLPGTLQANNWYDGVVIGGQTYNISDGSGTNHSSGAATTYAGNVSTPGAREEATLRPAVQSISDRPHSLPSHPLHPPSIREKILSAASPKWGNYCGAGWSAGRYALDQNPEMVDGKYVVKPTDEEDAACKKHDEGYFWADYFGTPEKKKEADTEFLASLEKLRKQGKTSWFTRAAADVIFRPQTSHRDDL